MIKFKKYICLLFVLCIFQCKKIETPPPVIGDPVFELTADLDGDPIKLVAGDSSFYMFTSFSKDSSEVYIFSGELKTENCDSGCGPSLRISIRNNQVGNNISINNALAPGGYDYFTAAQETEVSYTGSFTAAPFNSGSAFVTEYFWDFGNSITSSEPNPIQSFPDGSDRMVRLEMTTNIGCISSIEKLFTFENNVPSCGVDFSVMQIQGGTALQLDGAAFGTPGYSFLWSTGETNASIFYQIQPDSILFEEFCLQVTDANGCTSEKCNSVSFPSLITPFSYCSSNFTYSIETDTTPLFDPIQLSTIIIEYTNEQGEIFSSELGEQPSNFSTFNILENQAYLDNEDGFPTQKLSLEFSCFLYHENGSVISLENGHSEWGIAHP